MRRRTLGIAIAGVLAVTAVGYGLKVRALRPSPTAAASGFLFRWPAGTALVYDFRLETSQTRIVDKPAGVLDGSFVIAGDLTLRSYGEDATGTRLGLRFGALGEGRLTMLGKSVLADPTAVAKVFEGQEAILTFTDRGVLVDVAYDKNAGETFKALVPTIARSITVTAPFDDGRTWSVDEDAVLGRARSEYERAADPRSWSRRHVDFLDLAAFGFQQAPTLPKITSSGAVVVGAEGFLDRLEQSDEVTVGGAPGAKPTFEATVRVRAVRRSQATFVPAPIDFANLEHHRPNDTLSPEQMQKKLHEQTAAGLGYTEVESTLLAYGISGAPRTGWTTRAVALLMAQPELAYDLAALFDKPEMNARSRGLLLDLLSSAGHHEAQDAMRIALSGPAAKSEPTAFGMLLQRFSFVASPEPETVAFLAAQVQAATDVDHRNAALFSLGATAGKLHRGKGGAEPYLATMRDALAAAKSVDERRNLVAALGNAGVPSDVKRLAAFKSDASPEVRAELAQAMRKMGTRESRDVVLDLARDRDAKVVRTALSVLSEQKLAETDVAGVAKTVASTDFPPEAMSDAVGLAAAQPGDSPAAREILAHVLAHATDAKLRARVKMLLAQSS